jgi:hypothetical protein
MATKGAPKELQKLLFLNNEYVKSKSTKVSVIILPACLESNRIWQKANMR